MRTLTTMTLAALLALMAAVPAWATHTHVRATGNGACVILGGQGHESEVELPHAGSYAETRRHPLHVNVHLGQPGKRGDKEVMWVLGFEGNNCGGRFVNE